MISRNKLSGLLYKTLNTDYSSLPYFSRFWRNFDRNGGVKSHKYEENELYGLGEKILISVKFCVKQNWDFCLLWKLNCERSILTEEGLFQNNEREYSQFCWIKTNNAKSENFNFPCFAVLPTLAIYSQMGYFQTWLGYKNFEKIASYFWPQNHQNLAIFDSGYKFGQFSAKSREFDGYFGYSIPFSCSTWILTWCYLPKTSNSYKSI